MTNLLLAQKTNSAFSKAINACYFGMKTGSEKGSDATKVIFFLFVIHSIEKKDNAFFSLRRLPFLSLTEPTVGSTFLQPTRDSTYVRVKAVVPQQSHKVDDLVDVLVVVGLVGDKDPPYVPEKQMLKI